MSISTSLNLAISRRIFAVFLSNFVEKYNGMADPFKKKLFKELNQIKATDGKVKSGAQQREEMGAQRGEEVGAQQREEKGGAKRGGSRGATKGEDGGAKRG